MPPASCASPRSRAQSTSAIADFNIYPVMLAKYKMVTETKHESWLWLIGWVESMPDEIWASWKAFVLPLLRACVEAGLDKPFRAGQSMTDITLSTAEQHGLERYDPPPPRVTLRADKARQQWYIAWSHRNLYFSEPDRRTDITSENAFPILKSYLEDLWRDTKPNESLPVSLGPDG